MKIYAIVAVLLLALAQPSFAQQVDRDAANQPETAVAIALKFMEAVLTDAGFGPNATHKPLVDGPILVDRAYIADRFRLYFDQASVDSVQKALTDQGYGSARLEDVLIAAADTTGPKPFAIRGDAMVVQLLALGAVETQAVAAVRYIYTYGQSVCQRTLNIEVRRASSSWDITKSKLASQC